MHWTLADYHVYSLARLVMRWEVALIQQALGQLSAKLRAAPPTPAQRESTFHPELTQY